MLVGHRDAEVTNSASAVDVMERLRFMIIGLVQPAQADKTVHLAPLLTIWHEFVLESLASKHA